VEAVGKSGKVELRARRWDVWPTLQLLVANGGDYMGLVICPKHGRGFMFVCPHISEAVIAGQPCRGIEYVSYTAADPELADLEWACWFCPRCMQDHELSPNGTVLANFDEFMKRTAALYRPMCPGCFKDWDAQGLG
jgi:hypothetical protein